MAERNLEVNRPSTSTTSSTRINQNQPFRVKNSASNVLRERPVCPSAKTSPIKHKATHKQRQHVDTATAISSSINDVSTQCQNLNINNDQVTEPCEESMKTTKKKNARRKERLKQLSLKIPQPEGMTCTEGMQPAHETVFGGNVFSPGRMPETFVNQIGPTTSTNSRYFENLAYHPNFQYVQSPHGLINIPQAQHPQLVPQPFNSPQYLQNIMQHPLLCRFPQPVRLDQRLFQQNVSSHCVTPPMPQQNPKMAQNDSKKNKKKVKPQDATFDSYLAIDKVQEGLKSNVLLEGVLRINPKQYQHSYVSSKDRSEQDVFIDGLLNRNRALEGDVVIVQILNEKETPEDKQQKQQGKVVYIKEKVHPRTCIGTLKLMPDKNRQMAYFVPRDYRIPRLNIPCTSWPADFYKNAQNYDNTLFLAKIIEWTHTKFAIGVIDCLIGVSGDLAAESKAILAQNGLDVSPFGPEFRDLYPRLDYNIPCEEINLREDCRKLCIFSIDPFNCRDIDDAVSCRELENGNFEIGVHISDVAYYLTEDTMLDTKVAQKATTIYLVEKAYHMLPDELCLLCSLFPGKDKLAFSVFWEITKDGKVLSHRFAKTVINSCSQLAYEHAQAILDGSDTIKNDFPEIFNGFTFEEIYKTIKTLGEIAAIFRQNRFDTGALRIDQPKISFSLNSSGLPENFSIYLSCPSHQLIEEFMLLANMTVANRIYEDHPELAFLRCHPPPNSYMLKELANSLSPMGIELDISTAGNIYCSLQPHMSSENLDEGKAMVLSMLCAKPMARAKYFCAGNHPPDEGFEHYALNVPLYTHFTSPIRRYADIIVHRLLAASLGYREKPNWLVEKVHDIASQCNKQKLNAKRAGEMSSEFYTLKYIELHSPIQTKAVVVDIRERYIDVIVVCMGLNRRIFLNKDFPGTCKYIENDASFRMSKMEVTWQGTENIPDMKQTIEIFSIVNVELLKGAMLKVDTKLVRPQ